jgi:uncharacterized membrane protein
MLLYITRILKVFFLFMLIDGVWLVSMSKRFYGHYLGYLFADSMQYSWAILFYMLYAAGVAHFILVPYLAQPQASMITLFFEGFFFGLIVYSAYDLTNQATIKNWPLIVTVVDMLWGATLTGIVVILAQKLVK